MGDAHMGQSWTDVAYYSIWKCTDSDESHFNPVIMGDDAAGELVRSVD